VVLFDSRISVVMVSTHICRFYNLEARIEWGIFGLPLWALLSLVYRPFPCCQPIFLLIFIWGCFWWVHIWHMWVDVQGLSDWPWNSKDYSLPKRRILFALDTCVKSASNNIPVIILFLLWVKVVFYECIYGRCV